MEEFLKFMASPAGIAIFTVVALAIIIFFLVVNYRFFAKAFLDLLFGLIFFIIISPATAVCAVIVKKHAKKVCEKHWIVGKGGKPVCVRVFSDFSRGDKKSYCFLLIGADSEEARARLTVLKNNTDGFKIAEEDLKLRGGGDFMGVRQSGHAIADIKNLHYPSEVIFTAKKLTDEAFERRLNFEAIRSAAMQKYESLKDVILN